MRIETLKKMTHTPARPDVDPPQPVPPDQPQKPPAEDPPADPASPEPPFKGDPDPKEPTRL
jgi:hypothetical protein